MAVVAGYNIAERYSTNDWLSVFASFRGKTVVALNTRTGSARGASCISFQFLGTVLETMAVAMMSFSGPIGLLGFILGSTCLVSSLREYRTDYPDINETIQQVRSHSLALTAV
jgi:hypothetical protein